jgi:uncharacterized protein
VTDTSPSRTPAPLTGFTRGLLVAAGTLSVVLGTLGIFLPLLPTTPFLLLAAACYARSSPSFLAWLLGNRWFGSYIRNYRERRGLPLRQKVVTLTLLWLAIGFAAAFVADAWWLRGLLLAIATGVTLYLSSLKTLSSTTDSSAPCAAAPRVPGGAAPPPAPGGSHGRSWRVAMACTALVAMVYLANLPFYAGSRLGGDLHWRMEHGRLTLLSHPRHAAPDFWLAGNTEGLRWVPEWRRLTADHWWVTIPLWIPLGLCLLWTAASWRRRPPARTAAGGRA